MKRILLTLSLLTFSLSAIAAPIGEKRAREIATSFFASGATIDSRSSSSPTLKLEWAGNDINKAMLQGDQTRSLHSEEEAIEANSNALMYIYNRTDTDGFVIVAGDDNARREIIAYSFDNSFDTKNIADGAKAMLAEWCMQIEETRNNKSIKTATRAQTRVGNTVVKYETAKWGQDAPYNLESPIVNGNERCITGCVATAMSIACYYQKWPEKGVGTAPSYTFTKEANGGELTIPENVLGRTYEYDKMLPTYKKGSYTEEQGKAVAALMYDMGQAVQMKFGADSSGATSGKIDNALVNFFGFSKQTLYVKQMGHSVEEWTDMLQKNLTNYGPTIFRGSNSSGGGHCFILDGYSDDGYFSINYGWNGSSNGFYLLPNISYRYGNAAIMNMEPDRDGTSTYRNYLELRYASFASSSGRIYHGLSTNATKYVKGKSFGCFVGIINNGVAEFKGQVAVIHCDKNGMGKDTIWVANRTLASGKTTHNYNSNRSLSKDIEEGDCLRVYYKGNTDTEWTLARRNSEQAYDLVPICCTPEDVAKNTTIEYDKTTKILSFSSPYATQCSVTNSLGKVVASKEIVAFDTGTLDLSSLNENVYNLSFAASGRPYTIKLQLNDYKNDASFGLPDLGTYVDSLK